MFPASDLNFQQSDQIDAKNSFFFFGGGGVASCNTEAWRAPRRNVITRCSAADLIIVPDSLKRASNSRSSGSERNKDVGTICSGPKSFYAGSRSAGELLVKFCQRTIND